MDTISFVIDVIPRTKKNSSRIVKMGSRLADDNRNIVASHDGSLVLYDKERPRIVIEIKPLFGYNIW